MILVDVNVLLHLGNSDAPHHAEVRGWWVARHQERERLGLPWASLLGFVRLASDRHVTPRAVTPAVAWSVARSWLASPLTWVPEPGEAHPDLLEALLPESRSGADVTDAHLAALALEHGLSICTLDRSFARFEGVRWSSPLLPP